MELPPEVMVEHLEIALGEAAMRGDAALAKHRHLVHVSQHASAGGLRQLDVTAIEQAEALWRKTLSLKFALNQPDCDIADWKELGLAHVRNEHRKERAPMCQQETLSASQPQQVGVPIVVARLSGGRHPGMHVHQVKKLLRATQDHRLMLSPAAKRLRGSESSTGLHAARA